MSKPESIKELAKKLSVEAEGLLAPFGLPSGDKYKDCMKNLVDFTIEALTDWLESKSKLTCPYCRSTDTVKTDTADIGRCLDSICKHDLFGIKLKQYATEKL